MNRPAAPCVKANMPTRAALLCLLLTASLSHAQVDDAAYEAHVEALRAKLPEAFTIVVQKPFVVIGDQEPWLVRRHAQGTVKWAVDRLKAQYFADDPDHVIDIWLFKDETSYRTHAKALFDHEPGTPFGYYSPAHRAMVMNIATGGGTLVHEIVHPFMAANFPACPDWFNEGLGSLYEQSSERNGQIVGLPNWRLPGLQKAIRAGTLPRFEELCATADGAFYNQDPGTNYAQARYLCYYLQEKGLLGEFYRRFSAGHEQDPTGYATLVRVLGERDMAAFQRRWEAFVLDLTYP